jgi:hypothetical protein
MTEPIFKTIDVSCDPQTAFTIFTDKIATWWPLDKNSISAMDGKTAKSLSIEPKVGGRIVEIGPDDTLYDWGNVAHFEPGKRLTLNWQLATSPDIDPTVVDVKFIDLGSEKTRVELTHDNWQVYGQKADDNRNSYNNGWVAVFEQAFAGACKV